MKIIMELDRNKWPNVLKISAHDAPHRRQDKASFQIYRNELVAAGQKIGIVLPIDDVIDLEILFVRPASPDLDNMLTAFYRAVDGKALKGPSLLTDDGLIQKVTMSKFYPSVKSKYENRVP
jgi:hypothetical protein